MKKVVNITIGGIVFNVEDDAYKALSKYLDGIAEYFKKDEEKDEIISDIEISIAEKFAAGKKSNLKAVTLVDVENVIEAMGTIKDFKEVADQDLDDESEISNRKLYRDGDDQIIAGVASGLAAYFGIDSVIMRLIFFVTIFFGGFGVILYLILWIVMPLAETTTQKLNMRGERVTLKEIEKTVKSGVDNFKKKDLKIVSKFTAWLDKFFRFLGTLVKPGFEILRVLVGVSFVIAGVSGVFVLSFAIAWMLSGADIPFTQYVLSDFLLISDSVYALFNFSIYYSVLFPLIVLVVIGLAFLKRKSAVSGGMLVALLVIWFAVLGFVGSVIFQNAEYIATQIEEIELLDNKHIEVVIDEDGQVRRVEIDPVLGEGVE
jgi:phage shock protein PspC (stress-responsive transcriptional regulator)